jgi:hypothetical protein
MMARAKAHRKAEYTNATAPALPELKQKSVSRMKNRESNAVKLALHKILSPGVDRGVHT